MFKSMSKWLVFCVTFLSRHASRKGGKHKDNFRCPVSRHKCKICSKVGISQKCVSSRIRNSSAYS